MGIQRVQFGNLFDTRFAPRRLIIDQHKLPRDIYELL